MRRIVRTTGGWGLMEADHVVELRHTLSEILGGAPIETTGRPLQPHLLAPVDLQEVWASGVTYKRSLVARAEESKEPDVYERVYVAQRPELFFKSGPHRVLGPGATGLIRSDSTWDVPEPEVVLVIRPDGSVFGFSIGDDISSRSIEGENPLYLPQAKVYEGSAVVGPWIVPAQDSPGPFPITMTITRGDEAVFEGSTSTRDMARGFGELASWLCSSMRFPAGVMLMTGTGIVPPDDFTLSRGDRVRIDVEGIGALEHSIGVLDTSRTLSTVTASRGR